MILSLFFRRRGGAVCVAIILCSWIAIFAPHARAEDPEVATLKKENEELKAKVAALEKQLKAAGIGEITPEEKAKFEAVLAELPPEEVASLKEKLSQASTEEKQQMIRQISKVPPAEVRAARKRQEATQTLNDLRMLDSATDQYAIETNRSTGFHPTMDDLRSYLKRGTPLYNTGADVFGHTYGPFTVDSIPVVSPETFNALSDVADASFWSPFK